MVTILKTIEDVTVGVSRAVTNLTSSWSQGHRFCFAESSVELSGGITACTYYAGKFLDLLTLIDKIFTENLPYFLIFEKLPLQQFLGVTGIITNVFRGAKESLSLYRQGEFLDLFEKHAWKASDTRNALAGTIDHFDKPGFQETLPLKFRTIITGKKHLLEKLLSKIDSGDQTAVEKAERIFSRWTARNIRDKLAAITNLLDVELERALPEWLYKDIVNQGGNIYLSDLLERVDKGNRKAIEEATKLLDTMQSYAIEKSCVHILKITGAIIGALSCVGFFIAAPLPITVLFLVFIGIFAGAAYLSNSGIVENREYREKGFSWKLCLHVEDIKNVAFEIWNFPDKIRAWLNEKEPKVLTPHPFFERRFEIAQPKMKSYSSERLRRRTRLAAQGILLRAS